MSERGYIDGILATHFNECSIAAADAAKFARAHFEADKEKKTTTLQLISKFHDTTIEEFRTSDLFATQVENDLVAGGRVTFAISQPTDTEDRPLSLVAIFNRDMALPIATFEPRADGSCSYVQIGQEIEVDEPVVVIEGSTRTDQVEAIRELIKEKTKPQLMDEIFGVEAERYKKAIEELLPAASSRAAESYWQSAEGEARHTKEVYIVQENSCERMRLESRVVTLVMESEEEQVNGHNLEIIIGREVQEKPTTQLERKGFFRKAPEEVTNGEKVYGDSLLLIASIRGQIGISLAALNTRTGVATIEGVDQSGSTQALLSVIQVLVTPDHVRQNILALKKEFKKVRNDKHREAIYIHNAFPSFESYQPHGERYETIHVNKSESWSDFAEKTRLDYQRSKFWQGGAEQFIRALFQRPDQAIDRLFENLNVSQRLDALVDNGDTEWERVVYSALGKLAVSGQRVLSGVLPNHSVGKTKTDVATETALHRVGAELRIQISGRPAALEGFALAPLFDEVFSLAAKNEGRIDKEKADEIGEVLENTPSTW